MGQRRAFQRNWNRRLHQNLWDATKAVLIGKCIALNTFIRREDLKSISLRLGKLDKEEQIKSKVGRRKEMIRTKAKVNEIENRKPVETINDTKNWSLKISIKSTSP